MKIIAIDLGKFNSMVCFFDSETNEHRFQLIKTERGYLRTLLTKHPSDLIVMEACTASGWVENDWGKRLGKRTIGENENDWRTIGERLGTAKLYRS